MQRNFTLETTPRVPTPTSEMESRRLIDYTRCRRDGIESNNANTRIGNNSADYPSKRNSVDLPSCNALDASLAKNIVVSLGREEQREARVDFFLKVMPKSQRKQSRRISTLDTVGGRKTIMEEIASSRRSLNGIPERPRVRSTRSRSKSTNQLFGSSIFTSLVK